jgi:hypothetical protein
MNLRMLIDTVRLHFQTRTGMVQQEIEIGRHIRNFAKWWFDFVKNAIVVVALRVFADKADIWYVTLLYNFSKLILILYVLSYIQGRYYFPFGSQSKGLLRIVLSVQLPCSLHWD